MQKSEWYGGILHISAALFSRFGLGTDYTPDPDVERWLNKYDFRCVAVILLDALGTSILEKAAEKDGYFRSHLLKSVTTVFPPTTTAATTSFLTGRSPQEDAWLGWNQYFKEKDDQIILFREQSYYDEKTYPGFIQEALPVRWIMEQLNEKGIRADSVWPAFGKSHPSQTFEEFCDNVVLACSDPECRFVYGYWDNPDDWLHEHGPSDPHLPTLIKEMENKISAMAQRLGNDTGLMIIADHSQIDTEHYALDEDPQLCACFRKRPSLEARTVSFFLKEEKKDFFFKIFRERFSDRFLLMTHEEAVGSGFFGPGKPHERFEDFIGDCIVIAKTRLELNYLKGKAQKGNHAGGMEEEALIPVILDPQL